jgi:UDP-4-amino-4,6-dideoxy-N-acetyl-beta-L-altrosamine transaminase
MIPYSRQDVQQDDINAVIKVLTSDFLTQGPMVPRFEESICQICRAKHAVAVNSATSALHIALLALDVGPGDIIWTSPNTFVASANAALYCGATVDFVDIDLTSYNMSIIELEAKLSRAAEVNQLPKVVIPVHLTGQPCDMKSIKELSNKYNFKIVEDASHAIGAKYNAENVGNCRFSDVTVFSFHPVKIITTAEGGMALTNNSQVALKMEMLRSHGITRDTSMMSKSPDGPWYYEQLRLGYNYRMTDLQAALGVSQVERLEGYITRRHEIARRYNDELSELPLILPHQNLISHSAYHLYVVRLCLNKIAPTTHLQIFTTLRERGVLVNLHYIPVHTQPYYKNLGFKDGDFPNSEEYYRTAISIPMYPSMTFDEQSLVINLLHEILGS